MGAHDSLGQRCRSEPRSCGAYRFDAATSLSRVIAQLREIEQFNLDEANKVPADHPAHKIKLRCARGARLQLQRLERQARRVPRKRPACTPTRVARTRTRSRRPRRQASRSSAKSGDSGDGGPSDEPPPARTAGRYSYARLTAEERGA